MRTRHTTPAGIVGMRRLVAVLGTGAAVAASGCSTATGAALPLVRAHAAHDLDCPDADIVIREELGGRYKALGCGRKMTYRTACDLLACVVQKESDPAIPWRDRPAPDEAQLAR